MTILLTVDRATECSTPDDNLIETWVAHTLTTVRGPAQTTPELSIRITDIEEAARLNERYRAKSGPTNVLSFPADIPDVAQSGLIGDLVICAPVVLKEASEQHKSAQAHWAHLVIHGLLHLLGHDHQTDPEAAAMEALETRLLQHFGFSDPYLTQEPSEGAHS